MFLYQLSAMLLNVYGKDSSRRSCGLRIQLTALQMISKGLKTQFDIQEVFTNKKVDAQ